MDANVLLESATYRGTQLSRDDVLDRVGALVYLPDGVHVDRAGVAAFYGVDPKAIEKLTNRHVDELRSNGYQVVEGAGLSDIMSPNYRPGPGRPRLTVYTRRAVLLVGMLLRDSPVAQQVRAYLLEAESRTTPEARDEAYLQLASEIRELRTEVMPAAIAWKSAEEHAGGYLLGDVAKGLGMPVSQLRAAMVADGLLTESADSRPKYRPSREMERRGYLAMNGGVVHVTREGARNLTGRYGG